MTLATAISPASAPAPPAQAPVGAAFGGLPQERRQLLDNEIDAQQRARQPLWWLGGAGLPEAHRLRPSDFQVNPMDFSAATSTHYNALAVQIGACCELIVALVAAAGRGQTLRFDAQVRVLLQAAVRESYSAYGYRASQLSSQQDASPERMPTLRDVVARLEAYASIAASEEARQRLAGLQEALAPLVAGGELAWLCDQPTRAPEPQASSYALALESLPQRERVCALLLGIEYARQQGQRQPEALVVIDEAELLFVDDRALGYVEWLTRSAAKQQLRLRLLSGHLDQVVFRFDGRLSLPGLRVLNHCAPLTLLSLDERQQRAAVVIADLQDADLRRLQDEPGERALWIDSSGGKHWFDPHTS